jgi:hypothetical protein
VSVQSAALEAIDRILNRGGDADDVLISALGALHERGIPFAAIRFVEGDQLVDGPSVGGEPANTIVVPVRYEGDRVGELEIAVEDREFAERLATLLSAHVLVGWDTRGEAWSP